jgi:hypothetical protein
MTPFLFYSHWLTRQNAKGGQVSLRLKTFPVTLSLSKGLTSHSYLFI